MKQAARDRHTPRDAGSAILLVVGAMLVLSAMALSLVLLSMTESMATANGRRAASTFYAAQAGLERVVPDLSRATQWDEVLDGRVVSGFTDGPAGDRWLADGRRVNLDAIVNLANCGHDAGCTPAEMDAVTAGRPWGRNNPRWRLFAHGPLAGLLVPAQPPADEYLVVLVADDPAENDDDPLRDGRAGSAGAGVMLVRAEAFGPERSQRVIEATVARGAAATTASGYAAQRGEGGVADVRAASVQVPGGTITRMEMSAAGMTRQ